VYGVKRLEKFHWKGEGIRKDKFKRKIWLLFDIDTHDFKAGTAITGGDTPAQQNKSRSLGFTFRLVYKINMFFQASNIAGAISSLLRRRLRRLS